MDGDKGRKTMRWRKVIIEHIDDWEKERRDVAGDFQKKLGRSKLRRPLSWFETRAGLQRGMTVRMIQQHILQ